MVDDRALVKHNRHSENKHKRHDDLSCGSAKYKTCLLHVVASNGWGLHSTPLKWSNDQLEYHGVLFSLLFPVCEESPQLGVSRPYNKDQGEGTRVREGSNTHKSTAKRTNTAKTWAQMNNTRFTTRIELKSLRMPIECAKTECEWSRMLKVCLVFSSMH